jgi:hypothetical protein
MPPDDLPPPDPFPDLASAPEPASTLPGEEPSLLSEAQRRDFALLAGSFGGVMAETAAPESGPAVSPPVEHDFLLAPAEKNAAPEPSIAGEQPVLEEDFIALPDSGGTTPVGNEAEILAISSLAAALATPATEPPAAAPEPVIDFDDGDLPPLDLASLVSPFTPVATPGEATPAASATAPEPVAEEVIKHTAPEEVTPAAALSPITLIAAAATAAPEKKDEPAREAAKAAAEPPPAEKLPVIQFPPPRPESTPPPEKPEPVADELPDSLTGDEEEEDFDAPLLFPVPSVDTHDPQPVAAAMEEITNPNDRGVGMVLSGALLILLGISLACRVPSLALDADAAAVSSHALAAPRAAHLQGEMFVCALGAAAFLLLGIGSATLRRWAPPLIHATAWVVLLSVLVFMGAATAAMFHLSANDTAGDAAPGNGTMLFAAAGILGIALPLGMIALFQRPSVAQLCALVDIKPRWTDRRSVPALMVFVAGLLLAAGAAAMAVAGVQFPLFGNPSAAPAAAQEWGGLAAAALIAAALTAWGKRAGWWLLLVFSLALTTAIFLTCREHDWKTLASLPGAGSGSISGAVLAAVTQLPVILILLMTRRAFAHDGEGH